jgi:hypothetical protein
MKETVLQLLVAGMMGIERLFPWVWPPSPKERMPDPPLYVVAPGDIVHYEGMRRTATRIAVLQTDDDVRRFVVMGDEPCS